jgi:DNA-binding NarL/FixJ family response regulator
MNKARIVLADDHSIVLAGLRALIAAAGDLELVGEATSGPQALDAVLAAKPDVAIIDIFLPQMNGIVLARRLAQECPSTGVIVLTSHEDRSYLEQALEAGVRGYVLKKSTGECLIHAIRGVLLGGLYVDPAIAGRIFETPGGKIRRASAAAPSLTQREAAVLRFVATGLTNKEIAHQLELSTKSVETYKARAAAKLGVRTRRDIVRFASAQGWLTDV